MLNSDIVPSAPSRPNVLRVDDTDRVLLRELIDDARIPNNALAGRAGIAPSTCLARVRALRESGVITGFHAHVDPELLGLGVSALVSIRVDSAARPRMREIAYAVSRLDNVVSTFLLGGERDILAYVVCSSPAELREFISTHLGANPDFVDTQTNLVFEHLE